ncbi:hypothetical protein EDB85DRAFT_2277308 [Lactarius pseudohatsudake]|nr:hypothetical protein EDB85DRAFT_2277308 [Lactarius pseudohatsudake]
MSPVLAVTCAPINLKVVKWDYGTAAAGCALPPTASNDDATTANRQRLWHQVAMVTSVQLRHYVRNDSTASCPSPPLLRASPSTGGGSPSDYLVYLLVFTNLVASPSLSSSLAFPAPPARLAPAHFPTTTTVCMVPRVSCAYWMCVKPQVELEPSARALLLS